MRLISIILVILCLAVDVWACPSCVSAGNQKYIIQNLIAVSIMCAIPLAVVGFVIWKIRKIQNEG